MMGTALRNAIATRDEMSGKIAAAEEQIKEWRAKMQRAERFIADWEEFSGQKAESPSDMARDAKERETSSAKKKNPKKEEVAEMAIEIIREHGEPMTRDDLFKALHSKGVIIHGKNPPVVLQTMLWRMQNRIVHLKGFGYWPREDAYMAAEYVDESKPTKTEESDATPDSERDSLI